MTVDAPSVDGAVPAGDSGGAAAEEGAALRAGVVCDVRETHGWWLFGLETGDVVDWCLAWRRVLYI